MMLPTLLPCLLALLCFALLVWICMLNRGGLHIHHSLLLLLFLFLSLSPLRSFYVHHTTRF